MLKSSGFSTRSAHGGERIWPLTESVTAALYQTSRFSFTDLDSLKKAIAARSKGYCCSRYNNPTSLKRRENRRRFNGAQKAIISSSGLATLRATISWWFP